MAKVTLTDVTTGLGQDTVTNSNNVALTNAIENTLSLDGTSPNAMNANLDMNSYRTINQGAAALGSDAPNLSQVQALIASAAAGLTVNTQQREEQIATASQTLFTLTTTSYTPNIGNIDIYIDGVHQNPTAYTETSSTTVTFLTGVPLNASVLFVTNAASTSNVTDASAVTYTPSGAGALPTNVQAKLRESVSVKDFGAVGDGVTDDTIAIQAAITALDLLGGGILFFPDTGTDYFIASALSIPRGITLMGEGKDAVSGILCDTLVSNITFITMVGYTQLEKIRVQGNSAAQGTLIAITGGVYAFTGNVTLRDVRISTALVGLSLNSVFNIDLDNCQFIACGKGIDASPLTDGGDNGYINRVSLKHCYFFGNTSYDVFANPAIRISVLSFHDCTFDPGATTAKLYIYSGNPVSFESCYFEGGATVPVLSGYLTTAMFRNCYFNGTKGILYNATVAGNLYMQRCRVTSTDIIDCNSSLHNVRINNMSLPAASNVFPTASTRFWDDATVNGTQYDQVGAADGAHVPVLSGTGTAGTPVYSAQSYRQTTHGKICHFAGRVSITAKTGIVGGLQISLPQASVNATNIRAVCELRTSGITMSGGRTYMYGNIEPNTSQLALFQDGSAGALQLTDAELGAAATLIFSGSYEVA